MNKILVTMSILAGASAIIGGIVAFIKKTNSRDKHKYCIREGVYCPYAPTSDASEVCQRCGVSATRSA